jgi:ferritin-like protein
MRQAIEKTNNRTGLAVSPEMAQELQETVPKANPEAITEDGLAVTRASYAEDAEPVGTMPPPANLGGAVRSMAKALTGKNALAFMDKLGARLAFERSGVRLYQGLIAKHEVHGAWKGGPSLADLEHIRDEEYEHFRLLNRVMTELGGDPTAMTPSADLHGVISEGLPCAIADPRTNLRESMEAILVAELVDNDCWETLIDLARSLGHDAQADEFEKALEHEMEHLENVRTWLAAGLNMATTGDPTSGRARRRAQTKSATRSAARAKKVRRGGRKSKSGGRARRTRKTTI